MDLSSFVTSLVTSLVVFLALASLFTWLSRMTCNNAIYYPSLILRGLDPPESGRKRNPFAWIRDAAMSPESDVVATAGVDAATYILFLATAFKILLFSGPLLLPMLLPIAGTDTNIENELKVSNSNDSNLAFNKLDRITMANVQSKSPRLWAFLIGTYWVTIVTFLSLWKAYKHASELRASAKSGEELKPENFAILVRDIPQVSNGETIKGKVDSYFRSLYPEAFYRSLIITDNKEVQKIWKELEDNRKKLARSEACFAESKTAERPDGERPMSRMGFLGLVGEKSDTIDLCHGRIDDLLAKLEEEQRSTFKEKQKGAALIFFNNRHTTVCASQALHSQKADSWTVMEAPEPRQLIWENLSKSTYERQIRRWMVYISTFLIIVFYMIPITFISAFTTLENIRKLLPFTKGIVDQPIAKALLEAYLPQIALIVFLALLPNILIFLSKAEGIPSRGHVVRAASGKFYYFIVFNVFLGVTIGGTLFSSIKIVTKHPDQIVSMLGSNLPGNANFFLTFVALKFFAGYGLELCRVVPLIMYHMKRMYLCKTEEEFKEAWAPGCLEYATRVPNDMLILTIVFCYSVIAPLIIPFGILYFGLGWIIIRNQALKVYVPSYESNGIMWPHIHKRIVAALIIYQLTMIGYFGVKKFYYAPLVLPLPILSMVFAHICQGRFYLSFVCTPLEFARRNAAYRPNMDAIYAAYIPNCLNNEKFSISDQEPFEECNSHVSMSPCV